MFKLKVLFSGESHGNNYYSIISGFPSGFYINKQFLYTDLMRRKVKIGASVRSYKEIDYFTISTGVLKNLTTGFPITIVVSNIFFNNYIILPDLFIYRPGHIDFSSFQKYKYENSRIGSEYSSARILSIKTLLGSLCKQFLNIFNIFFIANIYFFKNYNIFNIINDKKKINFFYKKSLNFFFFADFLKVNKEIKACIQKGDSISGALELVILNLPCGLGEPYLEKKMDSLIAENILNLPSVKGIEVSNCFYNSRIYYSYYLNNGKIIRNKKISNLYKNDIKNGTEGGISTGFPIYLKIFLKHVNTIMLSNNSIKNKKDCLTLLERSDFCSLFRILVSVENSLSMLILDFFLLKFGSDNLEDIKKNYINFVNKNEYI